MKTTMILSVVLLIFFSGVSHAKEIQHIQGYAIKEYVQAIYLAEGGQKATYPFGIRSIHCKDYEECRRICVNTVRNNYYRWENLPSRNRIGYLDFLASRYAPIGVKNDPNNLNQNWIKNVRFFLQRNEEKMAMTGALS